MAALGIPRGLWNQSSPSMPLVNQSMKKLLRSVILSNPTFGAAELERTEQSEVRRRSAGFTGPSLSVFLVEVLVSGDCHSDWEGRGKGGWALGIGVAA